MYSLETGIVLTIAVLFFYSFLTFTFLRETNISKEVMNKYESEKSNYEIENDNDYNPEIIKNICDIVGEEKLLDGGDNQN